MADTQKLNASPAFDLVDLVDLIDLIDPVDAGDHIVVV
jgi:hypothetical protein